MTTDTPPEIIIRRATRADVPSLGTLGGLLVQEHHDFDRRRFLPVSSGTPQHYGAFLGSQLDDADAIVLVAEHDGKVIGYVFGAVEGYDYLSLRGPAGVVHDLIVDPKHRGHGVGRLLLTEILALFQSRRAPRVVLSTAEQNSGAQRLFERMGFRRTMIEMTRELDDSSRD
jgi:ribosomal protein S18 acetylase RimI-like enzyme